MPFKLVRDNFTNLRIGIFDSELCKTFKDAIIIAKHIGLQYVWIDSLCIVQDDPEDWRRESAKMSSVYGCSTINIAATSAQDGTMGCFSTEPWKIRLPITIRGKTTLGDFLVDNPYPNFHGQPLLHQAWVFQERFLAARTLHFTNSQIFWECKENHWSETWPNETASWLTLPSLFPKASREFSQIWPNAVIMYSRGNLTYPTDRLVAISGVAKWIEAQTKDDYLAGMWRKNLEMQLAWCLVRNKDDPSSLTRHTEYLAPSWSWASVLGSIDYSHFVYPGVTVEKMHFGRKVSVLSVHTVLEDENCRFGKVKGGVLRLVVKGLFFGIAKQNHPDDKWGKIVTRHGGKFLDGYEICWDYRDEPRDKVYILTLRPFIDDGECGLILEATDELRRAEYRRIGCYSKGRAWKYEPEMPLHEDDELLYEVIKENGKKLHVINII
jgi:hypothetical protein